MPQAIIFYYMHIELLVRIIRAVISALGIKEPKERVAENERLLPRIFHLVYLQKTEFKDLKFLKQGIENTLKNNGYTDKKFVSIDSLFDLIFQYVNSWYYSMEELVKFIFDNKLQYKYFHGIINTSPIYGELPKEKKEEVIKSVYQKYISLIKNVDRRDSSCSSCSN